MTALPQFGDAPASGRLPFTVYPESWGEATAMNDMSLQAGQGRSYKYLAKSVSPLYEYGAGLSTYANFSMKLAVMQAPSTPIILSSTDSPVCVTITNTANQAAPVVVTAFSATTPAKLTSEKPRLLPNRQLVGFERVIALPRQASKLCFNISDADVAMVNDVGAHIAYAGRYELIFFDGHTKITTQASVAKTRTVATIPAVDNPQPRCCMGTDHSCC